MREWTDSNLFTSTPNTDVQNRSSWEDVFKRGMDIVASLIGLFVLSPVFLVIAVAIKRDSPGPVFYRGPRLGKSGETFPILKFRTMRETAESYKGARVTARDDRRVTPLGRWLRDTKLNELPQLWNVLKGEMSLVGPRPEDPELATAWPPDVRDEVLSVRPGITSPASVLYRDEEEMLFTQNLMKTYLGDILPSKLRLDQLYIRRRSLLLDLDVLFWTFLVLLPGLKRHKPPEELLFWGLLSRLGGRYLNWFVIDTFTTLIAFILVGTLWRVFTPLNVGLLQAILFVTAYSILFSLSGAISGVQRIVWRYAAAEDALDLIPSTLLACLAIVVINYFLGLFPFGMISLASALAFIGYVFTRYRQRIFTGFVTRWLHLRDARQNLRERVLIVGSGETGQFAAWSFTNGSNARAFQVVGFVDDDIFKQDLRLRGINVLGKRDDIHALVEKHDVGVIVYAIYNIPEDESQEILEICRRTSARVIVWPDVLGFVRQSAVSPQSLEPNQGPREDSHYIHSGQVQSWLDHLENQLKNGSVSALEEQIRSIRAQLQQNN